jgi:peptide/nickel transport system permease protein
MIRFIVIRLLQTIIAFCGIIILVFFLIRLSGNPVLFSMSPLSTPEQMKVLQHQFGLDRSYWDQFIIYVNGLAHGDFGTSFIKRVPVTTLISQALPNTIKLGVPSFLIGTVVGITLGVIAATRRNSFVDNGIKFVAVLG